MPLFVVRHEHDADRCPATDPAMGAMIVAHMSHPNAARHGIELRAEAVVEEAHTLFLIVEAADERAVREFVMPLRDVGIVDVHAATNFADVVARGGCAVGTADAEAGQPIVDPAEACRRAIAAGLVVLRAQPLNAETSIPGLVSDVVGPNPQFYVRNHFDIPALDRDAWQLTVRGLVDRPLQLGMQELEAMPAHDATVTLECAGNGRTMFDPPVDGEPWGVGAVGTAEWTGVPLAEVLIRAGVQPAAREAVFRGADGGVPAGQFGSVRFERGLTLDEAIRSGALLAYAMNGEPLPRQHGYPLRFVVPGWYGVASVKWLTEIEVTATPFVGYFQTDAYVYEWARGDTVVREPVTHEQVRALIVAPSATQPLERGALTVRGVAWSGAAAIRSVEVQIDDGPWHGARLVGPRRPDAWQPWALLTRAERPGPMTIRARACDLAGRTQPQHAPWNRLGYGNNSIQNVVVQVR